VFAVEKKEKRVYVVYVAMPGVGLLVRLPEMKLTNKTKTYLTIQPSALKRDTTDIGSNLRNQPGNIPIHAREVLTFMSAAVFW